MTLDQIDETAESRLGDHFLVPLIHGLTAQVRALEARVAALEAGDEDDDVGEGVIRFPSGGAETYDVADDAQSAATGGTSASAGAAG